MPFCKKENLSVQPLLMYCYHLGINEMDFNVNLLLYTQQYTTAYIIQRSTVFKKYSFI